MLSQPLNVLYTHRGIPVSLTHQGTSYLMVFPMKTLAKKAQGLLTPQTFGKMYLSRHISHPSKQKTDQVLGELGFDPRTFDIHETYTDTEAYLHLVKPDPTAPRALPFRRVERSITDIILYPFVKNVGLILPLGVVDENATEWILESQMVSPSTNMDLFRKELEHLV